MVRMTYVLALLALSASAVRAADDDGPKDSNPFYRLDTKNLFGALEGADVGEAGGSSLELETTGSLFKRPCRFAFVELEAILEFTPNARLGIEFGLHGLGQSIRGVPNTPNYSGVNLSGISNEWRYVLVSRGGAWETQATLTLTPQWASLFEGGAQGQDFGLPLLFILDAQPISRRLYADINLLYEPDVSRVRGEPWARASAFTASGALSWRFTPATMLGAQLDFANTFDGLAAQSWRGSALFMGPTFHYQFNDKVDLSGAWTSQIAGGAPGAANALNLTEFTRSRAKLRLEIDF